jgi:hypothetical protein
MNSSEPRACHEARIVSGRFRNHPRSTASAYSSSSTLRSRSGERPLQAGERRVVPVLEQTGQQRPLVHEQVVVGLARPVQRPVRLAEPPFLRDLLDRQVATDRQVHDRRRDVERVRLLVDDRADLAGSEVLRRCELHRGDAALEQRHRLGVAGGVAHRLVDWRAHVAAIPAAGPEEPPAAGDQQQQESAGDPERDRRPRERATDAPRFDQLWVGLRHRSLRERHNHRERLEREEVPL